MIRGREGLYSPSFLCTQCQCNDACSSSKVAAIPKPHMRREEKINGYATAPDLGLVGLTPATNVQDTISMVFRRCIQILRPHRSYYRPGQEMGGSVGQINSSLFHQTLGYHLRLTKKAACEPLGAHASVARGSACLSHRLYPPPHPHVLSLYSYYYLRKYTNNKKSCDLICLIQVLTH